MIKDKAIYLLRQSIALKNIYFKGDKKRKQSLGTLSCLFVHPTHISLTKKAFFQPSLSQSQATDPLVIQRIETERLTPWPGRVDSYPSQTRFLLRFPLFPCKKKNPFLDSIPLCAQDAKSLPRVFWWPTGRNPCHGTRHIPGMQDQPWLPTMICSAFLNTGHLFTIDECSQGDTMKRLWPMMYEPVLTLLLQEAQATRTLGNIQRKKSNECGPASKNTSLRAPQYRIFFISPHNVTGFF